MILLLSFFMVTCALNAQVPKLIPQPVSLKINAGHFRLTGQTDIIIPKNNAECKNLGLLLSGMLAAPTGYDLKVTSVNKPSGVIRLKLNAILQPAIGDEGYNLKVSPTAIVITANQTKGLFYGIQTLMQLFPAEIVSKQKITAAKWVIPAVDITDHPRFGWRGLMLDVSRHFFTKQVVEAYIDEMAKYKFNIFHWHLTDDNGWRIAINGLPQLTDIGAWRVPRTGSFAMNTFADPQPGEKAIYGGYYTQDDIREVVRYAQARYITIVPEVDVPAHSLALIASIPNISCTQLQYAVNPGTAFYAKLDNVLCVGNDSTYLILDKIFTQVAALFPGKYIHVGGDEAYKGFWDKCPKCRALMAREHLKSTDELQSYFIKRVEQIVNAKGKQIIGWDEILQGGVAPGATIMSWRGMDGGIAAAKMGHNVIMAPYEHCYLDMYQGDPSVEPTTYGKVPFSNVCNFEPVPNGVDEKYILGGQGNLWTESVPDERQVQYMLWPRAFALAEVLWSPKAVRNKDEFMQRVEAHFKRLDAAQIKYSCAIYDPVITVMKGIGADSTLKVKLTTERGGLDIYYTFDSTNPDRYSLKYKGIPLDIPKGSFTIKAITYSSDKPIGKQIGVAIKDLNKRIE